MSRKDLDPNYYPPNYKEDAPILTDDLIQKFTSENKRIGQTRRKGEKKKKIYNNRTQDNAEGTDRDVEYDDYNDLLNMI